MGVWKNTAEDLEDMDTTQCGYRAANSSRGEDNFVYVIGGSVVLFGKNRVLKLAMVNKIVRAQRVQFGNQRPISESLFFPNSTTIDPIDYVTGIGNAHSNQYKIFAHSALWCWSSSPRSELENSVSWTAEVRLS